MGIISKYAESLLNIARRSAWGIFAEDLPLVSRAPIQDYSFVFCGWSPTQQLPSTCEWDFHKNGKQVEYRVSVRPRFGKRIDVVVRTPLLKDKTGKPKYIKRVRDMITSKLRKAGVSCLS